MTVYIPKRGIKIELLAEDDTIVTLEVDGETILMDLDHFNMLFESADVNEILEYDCNCRRLGKVKVPARFIIYLAQLDQPFVPTSTALNMFQKAWREDDYREDFAHHEHPKLGEAIFVLSDQMVADGRISRNPLRRPK